MIECKNKNHYHGGTGYTLHKDECVECIAEQRNDLTTKLQAAEIDAKRWREDSEKLRILVDRAESRAEAAEARLEPLLRTNHFWECASRNDGEGGPYPCDCGWYRMKSRAEAAEAQMRHNDMADTACRVSLCEERDEWQRRAEAAERELDSTIQFIGALAHQNGPLVLNDTHRMYDYLVMETKQEGCATIVTASRIREGK